MEDIPLRQGDLYLAAGLTLIAEIRAKLILKNGLAPIWGTECRGDRRESRDKAISGEKEMEKWSLSIMTVILITEIAKDKENKMQWPSRIVSLVGVSIIALFGLSGCGSDTPPGVGTNSSNVALSSAGASISANINSVGMMNAIDGSTSTATYWQAGGDGDYLKIAFAQVYDIDEVTVVASNFTAYTEFSMAISTDNVSWITLNNQTSCTSALLSSAGYSCPLSSTHSARYFRFTIVDNAAAPQIHEIQVMGK